MESFTNAKLLGTAGRIRALVQSEQICSLILEEKNHSIECRSIFSLLIIQFCLNWVAKPVLFLHFLDIPKENVCHQVLKTELTDRVFYLPGRGGIFLEPSFSGTTPYNSREDLVLKATQILLYTASGNAVS